MMFIQNILFLIRNYIRIRLININVICNASFIVKDNNKYIGYILTNSYVLTYKFNYVFTVSNITKSIVSVYCKKYSL